VEDAGVELLIAGAAGDGKTASPPDEDSSSVA
jgi:DeoR family transcriptional regulator, ulaG and ulaABCDEF operon transcriptional repressor